MRHNALLATTALALILGASQAHAAVTDAFCGPASGQSCETQNDQMVFLQKATDVTSGFGNIGGSDNSLPQLDIASDGGLLNMDFDLANGFATIKPAQGQSTFNGIDVTTPGFGFTELVFDTQLTPSATQLDSFTVKGFTFAVLDLPVGTRTDQADQDAEYSITAIGGFFTEVNILSLTGFDEIKHLEVGGLCTIVGDTCTPVPVPEPTSMLLLGTSMIGLGWARRSGRKVFGR